MALGSPALGGYICKELALSSPSVGGQQGAAGSYIYIYIFFNVLSYSLDPFMLRVSALLSPHLFQVGLSQQQQIQSSRSAFLGVGRGWGLRLSTPGMGAVPSLRLGPSNAVLRGEAQLAPFPLTYKPPPQLPAWLLEPGPEKGEEKP